MPVQALPLQLNNPQLWRTQLLVDGNWQDAASGARFEVINPAKGEVVARVADGDARDAARAIAAAATAQVLWAAKTAKERSQILRAWFDLVMKNQEDLARILTLEQGRALVEARAEIAYGASYIDWFAEEAKRIYGDVIAPPQPDQRILVIKQPLGVVAAITPWNFPNAMLARKLAPALAAGCALVVKPAAETPLSALALAYLAQEAGIPKGLINIVCGTDAAAIGEEFTTNEVVKKLSFTGSTGVGKKLIGQCAASVKKLSLELGGNAPFIVFADADLDAAVAGALVAKFRNAGQTCVCVNRFYIQQEVYQAFTQKFIAAVARLKLGDGFEEATTTGPLISAKACEKVNRLVEDALGRGAAIAYESSLPGDVDLPGTFSPVKVLINVPSDAALCSEEIFGPVAALISFTTETQVLAWANQTDYGLAAYFYTGDAARRWRFAQALEVGMVGINSGLISNAMAPFGGVKHSGWGREGSKYGLEDYVNVKYLCETL